MSMLANVKLSACLYEERWFRFSLSGLAIAKKMLSYFDPNTDIVIKRSPKQKNKVLNKKSEPKGICCAHCHAHITNAKNAIEVEGRHHHKVTNPNGITFNISMYDQANCHAETAAVDDFSWFVGYAWRVVTCPDCLQHLGWSYHKNHSPDFYGLITDKLIDFNK